MIRRIIKIDEDKCNGCGLCAQACHEAAIGMRDGKAVLLKDDYCDGLGDCLPVCPTGAITFEEREAAPYDEAAVKARIAAKETADASCKCQGSAPLTLKLPGDSSPCQTQLNAESQLKQWPVQLRLVPVHAPYYNAADLLIAADCTAYAYGSFHTDLMSGKVTLIGCPKLDDADYISKLTEILTNNDIRTVTVARMEVPCCGGLVNAATNAIRYSGKNLPLKVVTITADGKIAH